MSGYVVQIDDILGPASLSVVDPPRRIRAFSWCRRCCVGSDEP